MMLVVGRSEVEEEFEGSSEVYQLTVSSALLEAR